jgi:DUF971 family protein
MFYDLKPTAITADRSKREMRVVWSDGHESIYTFSMLRYACPCAECRGGHANMSSEPDPEVFTLPDKEIPATRMRSVEAVGSYAITIEWEDGHHYGIYNWTYLRNLCPCPLCRGEAALDG